MTLLYAILICLLISSPVGIWGYKCSRKEKESVLSSIGLGFIVLAVAFEYVAFVGLIIYWIYSHKMYG